MSIHVINCCDVIAETTYLRLECYLIFLAKRQMPHLMLVRGRVWLRFGPCFLARSGFGLSKTSRRFGWGLGIGT